MRESLQCLQLESVFTAEWFYFSVLSMHSAFKTLMSANFYSANGDFSLGLLGLLVSIGELFSLDHQCIWCFILLVRSSHSLLCILKNFFLKF